MFCLFGCQVTVIKANLASNTFLSTGDTRHDISFAMVSSSQFIRCAAAAHIVGAFSTPLHGGECKTCIYSQSSAPLPLRSANLCRTTLFQEKTGMEDPLSISNEDVTVSKKSSTSKIILLTTLSTLILIGTGLAQSNIIPSLYYTDTTDLQRDILVTLFAAGSSTLLINTISYLTSIQTLSSRDSRKLIHTLSAPLFCFLLPFYSSNTLGAQMFASSVVLTQMFKLLLAGLGMGGKDEESLAKAVSRKGNKEEAFGGPLIYCIVLLSVILFSWNDSTGIVTLSAMAAGDGMADIFGRRFGTTKWSFSPTKSVAGTGAFVLSSSLCSIVLLLWFHFMGCIPNIVVDSSLSSWFFVFGKVLIISSFSALIELSTVLDDNITVPLTAAVLSHFIL